MAGFPRVHGIPPGGATTQVLTKFANTDFSADWEAGGGGGGGANPNDTFIVASVNADLPNEFLFSTVNGYGPLASRPAAGHAGFIYFANDTAQFYRDNGATWDSVTPASTPAGALLIANNLSDLASAPTARTNLGLGTAALLADPITIGHGGTGKTTAVAAFDALAPTTTDGDLIARAGGTNTRVPLGASGLALASDGSGAVYAVPQDAGELISQMATTAIAATYPRFLAGSGTQTQILATGTLALVSVWLPKGVTLNSITFMTGASALTTPTHQTFGLFDSARNLLRSTSDDTTTAWAGTTTKTLTLTSPFVTTYSGRYYFGVTITAGGIPSLRCSLNMDAATIGLGAPVAGATTDTGLNGVMPATAGAITQAAALLYGQTQ